MYIPSVGASRRWRTGVLWSTSAASPRAGTIDNLKARVHKADREEPQINASFREFAHLTHARPLVDFAKLRLIVQP